MIAIVSKNDEVSALKAWDALYKGRFAIENFVARRINWEPKTKNILNIISLTNVRPEAVLFVDDNPAERGHVQEQVPGIQVLRGSVVEWRRKLLWAAELQPSVITVEGLERSTTIKAKQDRDNESQVLDREAFLQGLNLTLSPYVINDVSSPKFERCFELINKTNQFNTTGSRWSKQSLTALLSQNGYIAAFNVSDKYTSYGLTAVVIGKEEQIIQYVMSCRVFGLGVEEAAHSIVIRRAIELGASEIFAHLRPTGRNQLCLNLYKTLGFYESDGLWRLSVNSKPDIPLHVTIEPWC